MVTTAPRQRVRRSPENARDAILAAAEALLIEHGPAAVEVRAVATAVGMTDMGVNHHFGGRDALLAALLRHGGRKLKARLGNAIAALGADELSIERLVDVIDDLYADGHYGELALRLYLSGWRDEGAGLLASAVEALHGARCAAYARANLPPPSLVETRYAVATLHQALALDPIFGAEFRRSTGLTDAGQPPRDYIKTIWVKTLQNLLFVPAKDGA